MVNFPPVAVILCQLIDHLGQAHPDRLRHDTRIMKQRANDAYRRIHEKGNN